MVLFRGRLWKTRSVSTGEMKVYDREFIEAYSVEKLLELVRRELPVCEEDVGMETELSDGKKFYRFDLPGVYNGREEWVLDVKRVPTGEVDLFDGF
jgi:hypothetical protein